MSSSKHVVLARIDNPPDWIPSGCISIPARFKSGRPGEAVGRWDDGNAFTSAEAAAALDGILDEVSIPHPRPFYTRLPLNLPRMLPRGLRRFLKRFLVGNFERNGFPAWPIEPSLEVLRLVADSTRFPAITAPDNAGWIFVPTHDVDSAAGLERALDFARLEAKWGFRATYFLCPGEYDAAQGARALRELGMEIGIHGYLHDNRWGWLSSRERAKALDAAFESLAACAPCGVRVPSLLVTPELELTLARDIRVKYDSSRVDTGLLSPFAHAVGCGAVRPFLKDGLLEIPITLPLDSALIHMGLNLNSILTLWMDKCRWIAKLGGVAVLLHHPEPHLGGSREWLDVYERFLDHVAELSPAFLSLQQVAERARS